ncbi:MAG: M24 family metallopeptidase [Pararhizobium sp.]
MTGSKVDTGVVIGRGDLIEPLPFSHDEYERRLAAVRARMAEAGLDVFVAFAPENIFYLIGHDTPAYQYLQACVVTASGMPVNLVRSIDASNTLERSWSRAAIVYADEADPVAVLAGYLLGVSRPGTRIGLEDRSFFVTADGYDRLAATLRRAERSVLGARLVEPLRLRKSAEEIDKIQQAAAITDAAMAVAVEAACQGANENAIAAEIWGALVRRGSEFPGLPPFVVSGPRTSLGHATWRGRKLEHGDPLAFEIPGVVDRYVAPLFRSGIVGPASDEMRKAEEACLASLDRVMEAMKPGAAIADLHRLNVETFARRGLTIGHRTGYSIGVNYAPDWGEGHVLSIIGNETRRVEAGMTFHLVPGIYVPKRFVVVISETVVVTASGCEALTSYPRGLFTV